VSSPVLQSPAASGDKARFQILEVENENAGKTAAYWPPFDFSILV
jgi:hypothetical protein